MSAGFQATGREGGLETLQVNGDEGGGSVQALGAARQHQEQHRLHHQELHQGLHREQHQLHLRQQQLEEQVQHQPAQDQVQESAPASPASTPMIRILTHNVWGLKYIAVHRTARLTQIAQTILSPNAPDIVALQELFTYTDYLTLRKLTHSVLPHGNFYHSGIFGGGLVILSRWRIVASRMVRYSLNGRPSAFWRGDWYVGKGVAWAKVALPESFVGADGGVGRDGKGSAGTGRRYLEVFNTHLHAPYDEGEKGKDTYSCHRVSQAWEIAGLMRRAVERGSLVLGCGDFNMVVGELEWKVIQSQGAGLLRDVWRELHPESSWGAWIDECEKERLKTLGEAERGPPTVQDSLGLHGHTCDSVMNTWRWSKAQQKDLLKKGADRVIEPDEADPKAKRLDYIFLGDGAGEWVVQEARVCLTERHQDLKCSLSDHFGVEAVIVRNPPGTMTEKQNGEVITPRHQNQTQHSTTTTTSLSDLHPQILTLIHTYTSRSRLHRRRRLLHFVASIAVTLACFIAIWFSPSHYVSFLLVLLSSLGLTAGTLDGLIGGLFGGAELRALKELEWDVRYAEVFVGMGKEEEEQRGREREKGKEEQRGFFGDLDGEREREGGVDESSWKEEVEELGRVRDWWD